MTALELARGKWSGILGQWLNERNLSGKHSSCPLCGGKDRFRFDDLNGEGTWICSNCGAGAGMHLLMSVTGWQFKQAAQYIESMVGKVKAKPIRTAPDTEDAMAQIKKVWKETLPITEGDPVWRYLNNRTGLTEFPKHLRYHPNLSYYEDGKQSFHPAMIGHVQQSNGEGSTLHRTYLNQDGAKANVPTPKKLMTPVAKMENVAIRLGAPEDGAIAIAEGIETALAVTKRFKIPCWSVISAGLMRSFRPPEGVDFLFIYADNDESYTGQAAAFELANKIVMSSKVEVRVEIPPVMGKDWADW